MVGVIFDAQDVHESSHSFTKFTTIGGTSFKVVQPTATDEEVILQQDDLIEDLQRRIRKLEQRAEQSEVRANEMQRLLEESVTRSEVT